MQLIKSFTLLYVGVAILSCGHQQANVVISNYSHNHSNDTLIWKKNNDDTIRYKKISDYHFLYGKDTINFNLQQKQVGQTSCSNIGLKNKPSKYPFMERFACNKLGYSDAEAMYFASENEIYMIWGAENIVLFDYSKNKSIIDEILKNKDWLKADYIPPPPSSFKQ